MCADLNLQRFKLGINYTGLTIDPPHPPLIVRRRELRERRLLYLDLGRVC